MPPMDVLEDLMPFILMLIGMIAIAVIWGVVTVRQALDGNSNIPAGYGYNPQDTGADASAGKGSGMQG